MKERRVLTSFERRSAFTFIIALALFIGAGLFFWYGYRPSMVMEKCSIEAKKMADKDPFVYEIIYRHCLRTHGIEYFEQDEQKD